MNGVTLITCTGGRPESLARCAQYVARFENPDNVPVQWIVVDDVSELGLGSCPFPKTAHGRLSVQYLNLGRIWRPGMNTLAMNLLAALPHVKHDAVLFVEDDDVYKPDYMRLQLARLEHHELVGEAVSWYYHLPSRCWRVLRNANHASLCQTAMRSSMLPALELLCRKSNTSFIDWNLWGMFPSRTRQMSHGEPSVVGMKGLPGRPGIGIGHRPDLGAGWDSDPDHAKLREWLGTDAEAYVGPETSPEARDNRATARSGASAGRI